MLYLGSALGLYFPWDFCLAPGTSALASFPPRFVPPVIATLVAIAAVVSVFYCFEKRLRFRLVYKPYIQACLLHDIVSKMIEGVSVLLFLVIELRNAFGMVCGCLFY